MMYLVTGAAGFIGSATVKRLCQQGEYVVGIDNLNDYYDVELKLARLEDIRHENFRFVEMDINDHAALMTLFKAHQIDCVIHLAAQPGVRYSLENPQAYVEANLCGFLSLLEACRHHHIAHLVYASSSSVYGLNKKVPFSTKDNVDHPVSLYAATKKSNELMAHCYSHLYALPTTGLRFFTVYGPWGRPDMAPFIFTQKILNGETIDINNHGDMWRDFTHIDDIVTGVVQIAKQTPTPTPSWQGDSPEQSSAPYRLYNIGRGEPVHLMKFIQQIESELGIIANKNLREMQQGDVYKTFADTQSLFEAIGYQPQVSIEQGVASFINWYKHFYF